MSLGSSNPTTNVTKIAGTVVSVGAGVANAGVQRVVLATDQAVIPISDNGASLTVDGIFWQATQPVSHAPSATNALSSASTTVYANSLIAKASAGKVYNIVGYNSKITGQFIQIHNSATVPADGAVPVIIFYVAALSNFSLDYGVYGKSFTSGISICNSLTGPTKTSGSADCWFTAEVI